MKKILLPLILLILGLAVGGGAAYGTAMLVGPRKAAAATDSKDIAFVPTDKILAPLVFPDGRLAAYVSFDVQLEVSTDKVEFVTARVPLLLHSINMRTFRTPLASGPDGLLPSIEGFRKLVEQASDEAFGKGVVRHAAITAATPK